MTSFNDIFELMKKNLEVSDTARNLWIDPIKPISMNNNRICLYIADSYVKSLVEQNYSEKFKREFKNILGFDVEIDFISENDTSPNSFLSSNKPSDNDVTADEEKEVSENKFQKSDNNITYKYTFDTFIEGESNRLAYAACKAITEEQVQSQKKEFNPLYIYSEPGLGKTHLLTAVKNEFLYKHPDYNIIFVSAETFVNEFVNAVKNGYTEDFKNKYRKADVLLVDDVQFFAGKKESQNELFHTFNDLHNADKQIILTSDRPPKEINDLEVRLLTRFEWGLMVDIAPPEFETRLAIIKRKAELLNMRIPNNVMEYMADKLKNNIRQIEGAILKMNALSTFTESVPTLIMAQNIVRDVMNEQQPAPVTVEKIITEVSHIFNVSPEEIRSQNRNSQVSTARQTAIYVISKVTDLSYTSIGKEFGGRDHSTIVYAVKKVKEILEKDSSYRSTVNDIIKNISNL